MNKENFDCEYYYREYENEIENGKLNQRNKIEQDTLNEFFSGKYQRDDISEEELNEAKKKASFLGEKASIFRDLIEMVSDTIKGKFKINKATLAILIGAIVYVLSPADLIPDWIPIAGWIDDATVVAFIASKYKEIIDDWKAWKNSL